MINRTTKETIESGIQLHMVQSNKFKTVLFGIYIKRPLIEAEIALNALLTRVMDKATHTLPNARAVHQHLEFNYGTLVVSDVHKYGEKQMLQIKTQIPGATFIGDEAIYKNVFKLLNDMINHPKLVLGGFDPELLEHEKEALISEISLRKDHKDSWVMTRCVETMFDNQPYRLHELGTAEQVAQIGAVQLYEHLQKIWSESEIDICVIGDFDENQMKKDILEAFEFTRTELKHTNRESVLQEIHEVKRLDEVHDITQGKLCLGYRMNMPYESSLYSAFVVANVMLGGGGSSKLFKNIREKESLCYSIHSSLEKHMSIMLIYAGVDFDKLDRVETLVEAQIEAIKKGEFDEDELELAKKVVITNVRSISDYPNSYMNFYYNMLITEGNLDVEDYVERLNRVNREMVIEAFHKVQLDSVVRLVKEAIC